jgi:DNA-binding response OmpR family regulator
MSKILVIEDDRSVVFMLSEVLREAGHEVVTSVESDETLTLVDGVDAVLVDLHLPGLSGAKLIGLIRERRSVPVIVLTAGRADHLHAEARCAGAFDVMTKPVDIDVLSAAIERALGGRI